jgi:hypothetical protein
VSALQTAGFEDVRITHRYDTFGGTSKEGTARKYGVEGVDVHARKPL